MVDEDDLSGTCFVKYFRLLVLVRLFTEVPLSERRNAHVSSVAGSGDVLTSANRTLVLLEEAGDLQFQASQLPLFGN